MNGSQPRWSVSPTIQHPGFNLSGHHWTLLNCFKTSQSHCASCWKKWGFAAANICPCGKSWMMSHFMSSREDHRPRWRVDCRDCTQLVTLPLNSWRHTALINALDNDNNSLKHVLMTPLHWEAKSTVSSLSDSSVQSCVNSRHHHLSQLMNQGHCSASWEVFMCIVETHTLCYKQTITIDCECVASLKLEDT